MSLAYASRLLLRRKRPAAQRSATMHNAVMIDSAEVMQRTERSEPQRRRMALLTVTVEEADVFRVRRTLSYSGPHAVEFVRVTRIPRDSRVELQIGLEAVAVREVMSKVMASVSQAEFGRITGA